MLSKHSSSLEKLKQDRGELWRMFTKACIKVKGILLQPSCTTEEISQLRFTNEDLTAQFKDCRDLDIDIRKIAMD